MAELLIEDNDIEPALWIQGKDGTQSYVSLDTDLLGSVIGKEILFRVIVPDTIKRFDAARFALVVCAWQVTTRDEARARALNNSPKGISQEPDRMEIITMTAYDVDSEGLYIASITRNPGSTAKIGEWERHSLEKATGRFRRLWDAMK